MLAAGLSGGDKMRARIVLLGGALAILAACSDTGGNSGDARPSSTDAVSGGLPDACAVMRELDFAPVFSGDVTIAEQPSASSDDIEVTNCGASRPDSNVSIGLLMREYINESIVSPSARQAQTMIDSAAKGGTLKGIKLEKVEGLGEAALWSEQMGQLNVFYRRGTTHFIVTAMNSPDGKAAALSLAQQIVAKNP